MQHTKSLKSFISFNTLGDILNSTDGYCVCLTFLEQEIYKNIKFIKLQICYLRYWYDGRRINRFFCAVPNYYLFNSNSNVSWSCRNNAKIIQTRSSIPETKRSYAEMLSMNFQYNLFWEIFLLSSGLTMMTGFRWYLISQWLIFSPVFESIYEKKFNLTQLLRLTQYTQLTILIQSDLSYLYI